MYSSSYGSRSSRPSPSWDEHSQFLTLWHGCSDQDRINIAENGVVLDFARSRLDFGRGFYTTSIRSQAEKWAKVRHVDLGERCSPEVIRFRIPRLELVHLKTLIFLPHETQDEGFNCFVEHCRSKSDSDHLGPRDGWYDVVMGPVAGPFGQSTFNAQSSAQKTIRGVQTSFHTPEAIALLNDLIRSGDPDDFNWNSVSIVRR